MDLKDEVVDCAKKVMGVFTTQYTMAYTLALVGIAKEEYKAPKEPEWELKKRPEWKQNYKSGFAVKEGGSNKTWKKRWFVVKPSYNVEYYPSEEASTNPKKMKGSINLCGYWVNTEPNEGILLRLKKTAEKMGVDMSNIPKPKEYPPLTLELYHSRRRCYYITCSTKEEFDDWVAQFRTCCWHARGLTFDDDAHIRAFPVAIRKTRWELGRWGWYSNGGSEEQQLAELVSDELEYDIMCKAYGKLSGPYFVRNTLRTKILKLFDSAILAIVKPAWAGMAKSVVALKPKLQPKIKEQVEPICKKEDEIIEKMKDKLMSTITPLQEEKVNPHLVKILEIVRRPITEAFASAIVLFDDKITKFEPKDGVTLDKSFNDLDWFPRSYWDMRDATSKTEEMLDGLNELRSAVFSDLWPWGIIYNAQTALREQADKAVYTFEQTLLERADGARPDRELIDTVKNEVVEKFRKDATLAGKMFCSATMKSIVMPPFEAVLNPAAKHIVEPMADAVPEPMQELIDINQDFEDLYNGVIDDAIENVVDTPAA